MFSLFVSAVLILVGEAVVIAVGISMHKLLVCLAERTGLGNHGWVKGVNAVSVVVFCFIFGFVVLVHMIDLGASYGWPTVQKVYATITQLVR